MERISRRRAIALILIFSTILSLFAIRLFDLQIIETKGNTDNTATYTTLTTVRASRGDLLDRKGRVLVGNRASYNLVFNHYVIKSAKNSNDYLLRLYRKCQELGVDYLDHFPITKTRPFEYTIDEYNTAWRGYFQSFMRDRGLDSDISAPLLLERLRTRYKVPAECTEEEARAIIGMRYEFDLRGSVFTLSTYTFMEDVSDENMSAILELNTPGLMVESSTVREYHTTYGAHILGYVGGMDNDDWEIYKNKDYSMDAYIGQTGFEEAFEEYLHGTDGTRVDVVSRDGTIMAQYYANKYDKDHNLIGKKEPKAGNNVETTIDLDLQIATEDALASFMKDLTDPSVNTNVEGDGLDAEGAAAVVMDIKTGEILACASYPSFDLATMNQSWADIEADPLKPFFNRAFGAYYAPGSSYKMCTLIAAMENRNKKGEVILAPGEKIMDTGRLMIDGLDFHPSCLIYSGYGYTHRDIDASQALMVSCNVFFYTLGYRLSEKILDDTGKGLGLGEPTGIELTEKIGYRSNAESKKANYTGNNQRYTAGDRILSAIGQAENRFTPLQLCVYASTLANKGTRMKATFLNRVVSDDYRELIFENEPVIASKMKISDVTYETYMSGMRKVVKNDPTLTAYNGTAASYFGGPKDMLAEDGHWPKQDGVWPLKNDVMVYAKTGTAQHSSGGSDHAILVCFAKRKDAAEPEVAIAVFGEKAAHGGWLCPIAEDILEAYYEMESASDIFTYENKIG